MTKTEQKEMKSDTIDDIPDQLLEALKAIPIPDRRKIKAKVDEAYNVGLRLGFTHAKLRPMFMDWLVNHCGYHELTALHALPKEAKGNQGPKGPRKHSQKQEINEAQISDDVQDDEDINPTVVTPEQAMSAVKPEQREYIRNEEIRYNSFRDLITTLSGLTEDEQQKYDHNARELASSTKKHRFKIIKQMSDTDVRMSYGYSQEVSHLLNDFMQQLDDELDVRKAKSKLISE